MNALSHTVWTSLFEHFSASKSIIDIIDIVVTPTWWIYIQKRLSALQIGFIYAKVLKGRILSGVKSVFVWRHVECSGGFAQPHAALHIGRSTRGRLMEPIE